MAMFKHVVTARTVIVYICNCLVPILKRCRVQRTGNLHMLNKHTCTFSSSISVMVEGGPHAVVPRSSCKL